MTSGISTGTGRIVFLPAVGLAVAAFAVMLAAVLAPAIADAAGKKSPSRGSLVQKAGKRGCVVDRSTPKQGCATARALKGPGPFMGSRAIALSPNGLNAYVASSSSNAITIFKRNRRTGNLRQPKGSRGCIAAKGSNGCAKAIGLAGPNSLAVSRDGRNVYATSRNSSSITVFRRNRSTGALKQLPPGSGCIAGLPIPGCATGRALGGPDVVTISPDGRNVYAGSFLGSSIAIFNRDRATGKLTQPADETGCITAVATSGCAQGLGLSSPEGMAVSGDGQNVYVATAVSNAVISFTRDPATGALTQAADGSGCIVQAALTGCTTGFQLSGANAVAASPDDKHVYVTSLISSSLTAFDRTSATGSLDQIPGAGGCVVWLGDSGCTPGRALRAPEGLAVSPDGANVYVTAFSSGGVAVMNRFRSSGTVVQKTGRDGCVTVQSIAQCNAGRSLAGASSIVVSPDGRYVYVTAYNSNAVTTFRRVAGR
ncbi:MAG: beta-propeller fold lactonase family protein [Actinomycetota bacterium]|nr:beta-propeller fold lactonase family protein [Actinomycetota bacterium]